MFFVAEPNSLDEEIVGLLERMVENVSFALDNFEREAERERVTHMFAALSATNEAMMRAKTRPELLELVCEAAVLGGNFVSTGIVLARPGCEFFEVVAVAGADKEKGRSFRASPDASHPNGKSLASTVFRSKQPLIRNDYLSAIETSYLREQAKDRGFASAAGFPLLKRGEAIGVLMFLSPDRDAFTPQLAALLERLAENISFAMENFDRVDEKTMADERIKYLATHDELTGLANRSIYSQLMKASIETARRHGRKFALLFIDLDRFKVINDTLGHAEGDILLVETARRLRECVRASDTVVRLGGDEFVIILQEITQAPQVADIARKLLSEILKPLQLHGHECRVTASIGISIYPDNGIDEETLTSGADRAMYLAKEEGKNGFRFFSPDIKKQSIEHLMLEASLRHALERSELRLHYQPKRELATGIITGVEALLRWEHPDLGLLSPNLFIPKAEETGLIVSIGHWVLKTACDQNMAWQREGMQPMSMAVNLSPRQFTNDRLLEDIDQVLADSGMPPELLQLEVTESMVMHNVERAVQILQAIKSRGVHLAIDDFGTGYSSMSLLKRFPIDTLKIDRSFIRDLPENSDDKAIADAVIRLGKALGLTVIAEGVETAAQEAFLRQHACDEMQGFLYSKAIPPEQIPALLQVQLIASPDLQPTDTGLEIETAKTAKELRAGMA